MKINLTTTTIQPEPKEKSFTLTELREDAPAGVYRCASHKDRFPSERFVKTDLGLVCVDAYPEGIKIHPLPPAWCASCRFVLAPEQIVNITFEKENLVADQIAGIVAGAPQAPAPKPEVDPLAEYVAGHLGSGLREGDLVRVTRTMSLDEKIQLRNIKPANPKWVGRYFKIVADRLGNGFELLDGSLLFKQRHCFPFFVLEKVS